MLDPDLRKYFNLGKRKFSSIVKKPGVRRGFKLSQYIHPTDSPEEVNQVLRRIAEHIEYHKTSPVREVIHQQFMGLFSFLGLGLGLAGLIFFCTW